MTVESFVNTEPVICSDAREQAFLLASEAPLAMTGRHRFLRACFCRPVDHPPIWLMRQAGRALPEYRALKERYSFLELVQTPELATEVTLQPIRRFGFDAAIIFSDILVIPEALGQGYSFREGGGIEMAFTLQSAADISKLEVDAVSERLQYVPQALRRIHAELQQKTALLGFAGSPWTLANFMLEGGSVKDCGKALGLLHHQPAVFHALFEKLTQAVTQFLKMQIAAGVDAVQIFDSHGGLLSAQDFEGASGRWIKEIIAGLGAKVPVIVFSKGTHQSWKTLADTGAQVIGIDHGVRLSEVRPHLPAHLAMQGNLDPALLVEATPEAICEETAGLLAQMEGRDGHIFNLGHGLPPAARIENIEALISTVRRSL